MQLIIKKIQKNKIKKITFFSLTNAPSAPASFSIAATNPVRFK